MPHEHDPDDPWSAPADPEDLPRRHHESPEKKKMSTGMKILLILLSVAGLLLLLCCGAGFYIVNTLQKNRITDPAELRDLTAEIAEIQLTDEFQPEEGFDLEEVPFNAVPPSKLVIYSYHKAEIPGLLVLIEVELPENDKVSREEQLEQLLKGTTQGKDWELRDLRDQETRTFEIRGESVPFRFMKGTHQNTEVTYRQIIGLFPGRKGQCMLLIQIPDEDYVEEDMIDLIESIR